MLGSTSTGTRPFSEIASIEAMYVFAGTMTSSPGDITPISTYARNVQMSASSPLAHPTAWSVPIYLAKLASKASFSLPWRYQPEFTTRAVAALISSP